MKLCKPMKMSMKVHKDKCDGSGLMLNINKKKESIPNHSCSTMNALKDDFNIIMYSCTHDTEMWNGCIHRKHVVRLILAKEILAIWHESLYHSGARSRQTPTGLCKPDLRLFMHLLPFITNNKRNRNVDTSDVVARKYGEYLHGDNLDTYMCTYFYDEVYECSHCTEGETILNYRVLPTSSYN